MRKCKVFFSDKLLEYNEINTWKYKLLELLARKVMYIAVKIFPMYWKSLKAPYKKKSLGTQRQKRRENYSIKLT